MEQNTQTAQPKVFLDTSVLLKGFAAHIHSQAIPYYLTDTHARRFTFEKCVFEAYAAFRGVGGKKPDEGRGQWAERFLRSPEHPRPLGYLISKYHNGDKENGHYWINQILGRAHFIENISEYLQYTFPRDKEAARTEAEKMQELLEEHYKFETLCAEFTQFLRDHQVTMLSYVWAFGGEQSVAANDDPTPYTLDGFARSTSIPSEDFEIVYAALRIHADLFVTDDARLRVSVMSLGHNYSLSFWAFCSGKEYKQKIVAWSSFRT